jgi:hypothetical protein
MCRNFEVLCTQVGIAVVCGLDGLFSITGGAIFSLLHCVQTDCGVHPSSYPLSTGALSTVVWRPGREADHSPPNAEVSNSGALLPLAHVFLA